MNKTVKLNSKNNFYIYIVYVQVCQSGPIKPQPSNHQILEAINLKFDPFGPDRDCGDFSSWNVANEFFIAAAGPASDPHRLDGDRDGIPCESLR